MLTLVHEITTNVTTVQTNRSIQTLTQIGDLMEQMSSNSLIAVVDSSGLLNTDDAIVDLPIIGNIKRQTAKLTDLDVECQDRSTIYGMNFGIGLSDDFPTSESDTALYGNWTPNVIAQRMWHRLKCYSATNNNSQLYQDSFPFGAQSTTTLTELLWNPDILNSSIVLNELHGLSSDILSVRITIKSLYSELSSLRSSKCHFGLCVWCDRCGAPSPDDTLNFPGSRSMSPTGNIPNNHV